MFNDIHVGLIANEGNLTLIDIVVHDAFASTFNNFGTGTASVGLDGTNGSNGLPGFTGIPGQTPLTNPLLNVIPPAGSGGSGGDGGDGGQRGKAGSSLGGGIVFVGAGTGPGSVPAIVDGGGRAR